GEEMRDMHERAAVLVLRRRVHDDQGGVSTPRRARRYTEVAAKAHGRRGEGDTEFGRPDATRPDGRESFKAQIGRGGDGRHRTGGSKGTQAPRRARGGPETCQARMRIIL